MTEALFTLAGAIVGMLGSFVTELVRGRRDDRKLWREELRATCAALASEISRLRDLSHELRASPHDATVRRDAQETHARARALLEKLRLTSTSVQTQEAGRQMIHHVYYQWRATQGGKTDFWVAQQGLVEWQAKFYAAARAELDLDGSALYEDPPEGLPLPGANRERTVPGAAAPRALPIGEPAQPPTPAESQRGGST